MQVKPIFIFLLVTLSIQIHASTLTVVNEHDYKASQWLDAHQPKPADPDGDKVYGSAGYILFGTSAPEPQAGFWESADPFLFKKSDNFTLMSQPAFLALDAPTKWDKMFVVGDYGYPVLQTPHSGKRELGMWLKELSSPGGEAKILTLMAGPGFPQTGVRLGILHGIAGAELTPHAFKAVSASSDSGWTSPTGAEYVPTLSFIDIKGLSPGQTIDVYIKARGDSTKAGISGLFFDSLP